MGATIFTAAEIATALGKSKRAVQLGLKKIMRDGCKLVRGQQSDAWSITNLPPRYLQALEAIAANRGYRNAEHLMSDPPRRFVPRDKARQPVPVSDIAPHLLDRAARLRDSLALTLKLRERLTESDSKPIALAAFRRVWGNASEKTWDRLLKRTIQRDAGEERFEDLALYFDEVVTRKPAAREKIAIGAAVADRMLLDALVAKDLAKPTLTEKARIWEAIAWHIDEQIGTGAPRKRVMRRVFTLIVNSRINIARTDDALKRLIKEKFQRWIAGGRISAALEDQRPAKSGPPRAPKLSDEVRHKIIGHTVKNCGGRLSQGYRELLGAGELPLSLTTRFIANSANKSYVPSAVRRSITPDVNRLASYHRGPREHRLGGAFHSRDWSQMPAGDWFQSDDLTPPVYFYKLGAGGRIDLTRGQFLPMIDERTGMILGFVLIPEKTYNSLSIRSLITNVCSVHGLPRRGFAFERGIWKSSKILTGTRGVDLEEIADTGIRRLGMTIRHAILPRAKVVERLLGQLQDRMEGLPGYCGRNEQTEKFEGLQRAKLDVEAGRADVRDHFLSAKEMKAEFAAIAQRYNDEPQQGKRLNGLSPVEGWQHLQSAEPRMRFDDRLLYFLASDLRRLKVGRNGLTISIGKQRFNYKGEETGQRVGETVFAWFNPQRSDLLTCTSDLNGSGAFTVERSYDLPAVDAPRELIAEENRKIRDHNRYASDLYHVIENTLPAAAFRGQLVGTKVVELGDVMANQQGEKRTRRTHRDELDDKIIRAAKRAGRSPEVIPRTHQALEGLEMYAKAKAELESRESPEEESL